MATSLYTWSFTTIISSEFKNRTESSHFTLHFSYNSFIPLPSVIINLKIRRALNGNRHSLFERIIYRGEFRRQVSNIESSVGKARDREEFLCGFFLGGRRYKFQCLMAVDSTEVDDSFQFNRGFAFLEDCYVLPILKREGEISRFRARERKREV